MRKPTTIAHIAGGLLAGYSLWLNSAVGLALIGSFMAFEVWQAYEMRYETHGAGALDFLEFVVGLFIGATMGLIANVI